MLTSTIEAAILNAIKAMTKEIIENEDEFAEQLQAAWENQNTQVSSESKKELHSVQKKNGRVGRFDSEPI